MATIQLMVIGNVDTTKGVDSRSIYAMHMLADNAIEFHETYNSTVFFERAKQYLLAIDSSVCSLENSTIDKVFV